MADFSPSIGPGIPARARPLIDELHKWMEKMLRSLSTKSETAGAICYALSHWRALTRYIDDGLVNLGTPHFNLSAT